MSVCVDVNRIECAVDEGMDKCVGDVNRIAMKG